MNKRYFEPSQEAGAVLFARNISGEVIMLNLLRFRAVADYTSTPELAPETPISGRQAYQYYIDHTRPFLQARGGEILLLAEGGKYLIGPEETRWDLMMLIRQNSFADFMAFASDEAYLAGIGHRTAALEDSRLLPLVAYENNQIV